MSTLDYTDKEKFIALALLSGMGIHEELDTDYFYFSNLINSVIIPDKNMSREEVFYVLKSLCHSIDKDPSETLSEFSSREGTAASTLVDSIFHSMKEKYTSVETSRFVGPFDFKKFKDKAAEDASNTKSMDNFKTTDENIEKLLQMARVNVKIFSHLCEDKLKRSGSLYYRMTAENVAKLVEEMAGQIERELGEKRMKNALNASNPEPGSEN